MHQLCGTGLRLLLIKARRKARGIRKNTCSPRALRRLPSPPPSWPCGTPSSPSSRPSSRPLSLSSPSSPSSPWLQAALGRGTHRAVRAALPARGAPRAGWRPFPSPVPQAAARLLLQQRGRGSPLQARRAQLSRVRPAAPPR